MADAAEEVSLAQQIEQVLAQRDSRIAELERELEHLQSQLSNAQIALYPPAIPTNGTGYGAQSLATGRRA